MKIFFLLTIVVGACMADHKSVVYLWAGQDPNAVLAARDFVAAVQYDRRASDYGEILSRSSLRDSATVKANSNEPHHAALSEDCSHFVTGGLLSFLQGSAQVFSWKVDESDVSNAPSFARGLNPAGGCTDEFRAVGGTKFLVTQMCSRGAVSPGEIIAFDAATGDHASLTNSSTNNPNELTDFTPHGFDLNADNHDLVSVDYIVPATLLASSPADVVLQNTIRHFSWQEGDTTARLERTWVGPVNGSQAQIGTGQGFMDVVSIPGTRFFVTCGTSDQLMRLVDPQSDELEVIFDLNTLVAGDGYVPSAGIMQMSDDGKRLLMTYRMRYVMLFDFSDDVHAPTHLHTFDFCTSAELASYALHQAGTDATTTYSAFCAAHGNLVGSHYIKMTHDDDDGRFLVVNYFLHFGLATFAGSRTVHSFTLNDERTSFTIDLDWDPNPALAELHASPHTAHYIRAHDDGSIYCGAASSLSTIGTLFTIVSLFIATILF